MYECNVFKNFHIMTEQALRPAPSLFYLLLPDKLAPAKKCIKQEGCRGEGNQD